MPITDKSFTAEELDSVLTENPALIPFIQTVAEKRGGYFAPDGVSKKSYEDNVSTNAKSALTLEHATALEKDVEEITGIKKEPGEKYYDFNKRVLKLQTESAKKNSTELATLKSQTDLTAAEKQRMAQLEALVLEKDTKISTIETERQSEVTRLKVENNIYNIAGKVDSKLKKNPELQDAIGIVREKAISEMIAKSLNKDGKFVFLKEDGSPYVKADASYMNAEEVLLSKMDKWVDKGKQVAGAGGNSGPDEPVTDGQFKTKVEVDRFIQTKGLIQGTKEFSTMQKQFNYDKLPMK